MNIAINALLRVNPDIEFVVFHPMGFVKSFQIHSRERESLNLGLSLNSGENHTLYMSADAGHKQDFIIDPNYKSGSTVFNISPPVIETGYVYFFTSGSGLLYEVRFAPKSDNILGMVVNFTVVSDEFDHDYPVTNRGELYSVIATVIEIIRLFHSHHNFTTSYEFSGEFKDSENKEIQNASIRSRLYLRYAPQVLNNHWKPFVIGNKVILKKVK